MHAPSDKSVSSFESLRAILAKYPRETLLYDLHIGLRNLVGHLSNISAVIYQDLAHWINNEGVPKPDVFWHSSLFKTPTTTPTDANSQPK